MIRSWFQRRSAKLAHFDPVAPPQPFIAVGDVHGRADLLDKLLQSVPDVPLIFVGDYVDRGDHSADVLRILKARPDITCIAGNHEQMMLKFLREPEEEGPRWLRYGGLQTLASFGITGITESTTGGALTCARDALMARMGDDLIGWVYDLPTSVTAGNVTVVHAGADPALPIEHQTRRVLQWGHPEFRRTPRRDGMWIVHGHTIVDEAYLENGRIAVDTGAYATSRLSAAFIGNGEVIFDHV
ncbi:metallophosphoesterase [Aestuariivita boseongensis]|uniref:metallophosphoesterase n=1 Tax=Aestuariivita boseongensis TaxID=1470562 RepID=UPI00067F959E|nr:metallophosphoesterase [Aestuariivita boseongensis]